MVFPIGAIALVQNDQSRSTFCSYFSVFRNLINPHNIKVETYAEIVGSLSHCLPRQSFMFSLFDFPQRNSFYLVIILYENMILLHIFLEHNQSTASENLNGKSNGITLI